MNYRKKIISTQPNITVFENILNQDQVSLLKNNYNSFAYGWKSDSTNVDDPGHWNKLIVGKRKASEDSVDVRNNKEFVDSEIYHVWQDIVCALGNRNLLRCYFNGYTYGTEGYIHKDSIPTLKNYNGQQWKQETILIYCNPEDQWDSNWAGETVFFDETKQEIIYSTLPVNSRIILFDSDIFHTARSVSRACKTLRKILVFKTIKYVVNYDVCKRFIEMQFADINHSKKMFTEHLFNTYEILKSMQFSEDICIAGLFHSIYGTEYFSITKEPPSREQIKLLVGDDIEDLVYEFCNLKDRFSTIVTNKNNWSKSKQYQLAAIEYANLIEQQPRMNFSNFSSNIKLLKPILNI